MGMRVDEAGRHDQVAGVDGLAGAIADLANFGKASAGNRDVGAIARRAGAVNHHPVADQRVIRHASVLLLACLLPNRSASQVDGSRLALVRSRKKQRRRRPGCRQTACCCGEYLIRLPGAVPRELTAPRNVTDRYDSWTPA